MRLTNYIRDAFIDSVMNDTPCTDYKEQARKLALADVVDQLPPKVKAVWDAKDLRDYIDTATLQMGSGYVLGSVTVPGVYGKAKFTDATKKALDELQQLAKKQSNDRDTLRSRLKSIAYACSTRKALAEALPEFEKYLPDEEKTSRSLPVVSGVVSDFVKAGWPKDKKVVAA